MSYKHSRKSELERQMLEAMARSHFASFVYLAFRVLHPGQRLIPSWHIDLMCWHVQKMAEGDEPPRCIFNLPPRSLKSFVLSICLPAWLLGRNPSTKIICISYSEELAKKFSRECRALIQSEFYRRIFPGTELNPQKSTEIEFETTRRGYRLATSIGGTLTGRGGEWLILDDVNKAEDGTSERARESVAEWFKHSARSRLDNQRRDKIILAMQRLHIEDLSGLLIKAGWPCIAIPAIATEARRYEIGPDRTHDLKPGDLLQPELMDQAALDQAKAEMGSHTYSAQYQQNPLPDDGDYVRMEHFLRVDVPEEAPGQRVVMSVDPAAKKGANNDFTAITIWQASLEHFYLRHACKGRWNVTETLAHIVTLAEQFEVRTIIVEDTSSGTAVLELLRQRHLQCECLGRHPKDDKLTRLLRQIGKIETHMISLLKDAAWAKEFLEEVVNFPSARHDDYVDSLLQFLEWVDTSGLLRLFDIPCGPKLISDDDD